VIGVQDDLPRHVVPDSPDAYERYFFLAASPEGDLAVSAVVNVHPNRGLIDAAFAVSDGETHESVFTADRLGEELVSGPIRLELTEPMRSLRIEVEGRADLCFRAVCPPIEEERVTRRRDGRVVQDRERYVQLGTVEGVLDGREVRDWFAGRDHSWGIWDAAGRTHSPSFFWLIGAFADRAVQIVTHIDTDGRRYGEYAAVVAGSGVREPRTLTSLDVQGPSHFTTATVTLGDETLALESLHALLPRAVGYGHPTWVWGAEHPELPHVIRERIDLRAEDLSARNNQRALQFVRIAGPGGAAGYGVVDQYLEV
jgi:hypothetical protein